MKLTLATPPDFSFISAVCSHGFFVLAPHEWHPPSCTLATTLTLAEDFAVRILVRAGPGNAVSIRVPAGLDAKHRELVRARVGRMLRLDEDLSGFHELCRKTPTHLPAAEIGFGRLLRSATLFEDIVKVICTCNVTWRQTTAMVKALVAHWGVEAEAGEAASKGFPTPQRLARVRESTLKARARVGYRSRFLLRLAREIADGRLDLQALEHFDGPSDELHRRLRQIGGVGDYAAGNLCMLLGRYDRLAIDTEMVRHLRNRFPRRTWTAAAMKRHYDAWRPYQFLAYWYELWDDYVKHHGASDQWWPDSTGERITRNP